MIKQLSMHNIVLLVINYNKILLATYMYILKNFRKKLFVSILFSSI